MVDWFSLTIPLAYLGILIGSLATFSSLYRKRKAANSLSLKPWFPPNLQRDIYLSLLHLEPSGSKEKKSPAVPESVLKAALLRRAAEDITRLLELRNQKPALAQLLQKGSVGDDLWQRLLRAEKEMEDEVGDVVAEANAFAPNWGQTIFQSANEMAVNAAFRKRLEDHQATVNEEKEWWDKKKASIQEDFMKELNEEGASDTKGAKKASSSGSSAQADKPPAAATPAPGSDDDAVLVESGGPAVSGGGGGGNKKKKKGKK